MGRRSAGEIALARHAGGDLVCSADCAGITSHSAAAHGIVGDAGLAADVLARGAAAGVRARFAGRSARALLAAVTAWFAFEVLRVAAVRGWAAFARARIRQALARAQAADFAGEAASKTAPAVVGAGRRVDTGAITSHQGARAAFCRARVEGAGAGIDLGSTGIDLRARVVGEAACIGSCARIVGDDARIGLRARITERARVGAHLAIEADTQRARGVLSAGGADGASAATGIAVGAGDAALRRTAATRAARRLALRGGRGPTGSEAERQGQNKSERLG